MSIRFHKGPSIITLFHDATSPTSKQVLHLLSSYATRSRSPCSSSSNDSCHPGCNGDSCVISANNAGAGEYLRSAASDPPSPSPIQLEVVDRRTNPPTQDQLRSIIDYLATDPTSLPAQPNYTKTGFDLEQHERRNKLLDQHLAKSGEGMPKIKDGPLVVNWDEGSAATSLEGVKEMLKRLEEQAKHDNHDKDKAQAGGGCTIC